MPSVGDSLRKKQKKKLGKSHSNHKTSTALMSGAFLVKIHSIYPLAGSSASIKGRTDVGVIQSDAVKSG